MSGFFQGRRAFQGSRVAQDSFPLVASTRRHCCSAAIMASLCALLLAGCASEAEKPPAKSVLPPSTYDVDSWKSIIPPHCQHYSDGCNVCNRNAERGLVACTRKACFAYQRPECLDDSRVSPGSREGRSAAVSKLQPSSSGD